MFINTNQSSSSSGLTLDPTDTNNISYLSDEGEPVMGGQAVKAHRPKQKKHDQRKKQSGSPHLSSLHKATSNLRILWIALLLAVALIILLAIVIAKFGRHKPSSSSLRAPSSSFSHGPFANNIDESSESIPTLHNNANNIFDHSLHTSKPESSQHPTLRATSIPTAYPTPNRMPVSSASPSALLPSDIVEPSQTPSSSLVPSPPPTDPNRRQTFTPLSNATLQPTPSASRDNPTLTPTTGSLPAIGIPEKEILRTTSSPTTAEPTTATIVNPTMAPSARPSSATPTTGSPSTAIPTSPTTEPPTTNSPTAKSWKGFKDFIRTELAEGQTCRWESNSDFFEIQDLSENHVMFETRHTITSPGLNIGNLNWMAAYFTEQGGAPHCSKVQYMQRGDSNAYMAECNSCGVAVIEVYAFNGKFSKTRDVAEVPAICKDEDDDQSSSNSVPGRVCGWTITVPCLGSEGAPNSSVSGC